jgi:hypothetical protein
VRRKTFQCGHRITPENTKRQKDGDGHMGRTCRYCHMQRKRRADVEKRAGSLAGIYARTEELMVFYIRLRGFHA